MRVMAIDLGDVRTGVAFSDITGTLTGEAFTIQERNPEKLIQKLCEEVIARGVTHVVMGYPKNMNGTEGIRAEKYATFAGQLENALGMPVVLWDERRTTTEAHQILSTQGRHGRQRKKTVDAVAAALILEGYLTFLHQRGK